MRNMRHIVTIYRPTEATGTGGAPQGQDQVLMRDVPCSITTMSGREGELARQIFAAATHQVGLYGNPEKPLLVTDYLMLGKRRLNIGFKNDKRQNEVELELLCEEVEPVR